MEEGEAAGPSGASPSAHIDGVVGVGVDEEGEGGGDAYSHDDGKGGEKRVLGRGARAAGGFACLRLAAEPGGGGGGGDPEGWTLRTLLRRQDRHRDALPCPQEAGDDADGSGGDGGWSIGWESASWAEPVGDVGETLPSGCDDDVDDPMEVLGLVPAEARGGRAAGRPLQLKPLRRVLKPKVPVWVRGGGRR